MKFNYLLGVGILLSLIGASLLLALGILYIRPFVDTRYYVEGKCRLLFKNITSLKVVCQCSADGNLPCTSEYPCAKVKVQLTTSTASVFSHVLLYDSYETYNLQKNSYHCSYHKCGRSDNDNHVAVSQFLSKLDDSFTCYHEKFKETTIRDKEGGGDDAGGGGGALDDDGEYIMSYNNSYSSDNDEGGADDDAFHHLTTPLVILDYNQSQEKYNNKNNNNYNKLNNNNQNNRNSNQLHGLSIKSVSDEIFQVPNNNTKNNSNSNNNINKYNNNHTKQEGKDKEDRKKRRRRNGVRYVLLEVVTLVMVVNSVFWPALTLLVGLLIFCTQVHRFKSSGSNFSDSDSEGNLTIGGRLTEVKNRSPFSSLERQWARIKERTAYNHHKIASERLFDRADKSEETMGHVAHVIG